jgi:hypothetical protein
MKIRLSGYFIRSDGFTNDAHPKSGILEGSNDNMNWTLIDNQIDQQSLNES